MTKLSLIRDFSHSKKILLTKIYNLPLVKALSSNCEFITLFFLGWSGISFVSTFFYNITNYFLIAIYWLTLGIMSSIGFGTGLQTGMLFVIPKIVSVYNSELSNYISTATLDNNNTNTNSSICLVETYNTSSYNISASSYNISASSYNISASEYNNISNSEYNEESNFDINLIIQAYLKCIPFVFMWGLGTALGELPPYFIAYNIDLKNKTATDKLYNLCGSNKEQIKEYVEWSINKLKKNSFLTIIMLSSWPNAFFDMCGIAAGFVKLSLSQFLIPTIIGKAVIKINCQLILILTSLSLYGNTFNSDNKHESYHFYFWLAWISVLSSITLYFIKEALENIVNS